ncbi:MAG: hypothetical protein V3S69_05335 [Dehalococcoidales bacterium]
MRRLLYAVVLVLCSCSTIKDAALGALGGGGGLSASASYEKTEGTKNETIETNGTKTSTTTSAKAETIGEVSTGRTTTILKGENITNRTVYDKLPLPLIAGLILLMLIGWMLPTPTTMWKAWRNR